MSRSRRLRIAGALILACGIGGAATYYWSQMRSAAAMMDEFAAGYSKARDRQMGMMMGTMGLLMSGWMDSLTSPGGQAIGVMALAALIAAMCFRVAWLMDLPETDERRWPQ